MGNYVRRILRYTWPPAIIAIVILYLCCLIPGNEIPDVKLELFLPTDKVVHFLMFFGLSIVASFNYISYKSGHIIILKLIVFAVLLPILYGGLIEIVQDRYFTERSGDWYDFLADSLGAMASIPFSLRFREFLLKRQEII